MSSSDQTTPKQVPLAVPSDAPTTTTVPITLEVKVATASQLTGDTTDVQYAEPGFVLVQAGASGTNDASKTTKSEELKRTEGGSEGPSETTQHVDNITRGLAGAVLTAPAALYEAVVPDLRTHLHNAEVLASDAAQRASQAAHDLVSKVHHGAQETAATVQQTAGDAAHSASQTAQDLASKAHQGAQGAAASVQDTATTVQQTAGDAATSVQRSVPDTKDVKGGVERAIDVVRSYLPEGLGGVHHEGGEASRQETRSTDQAVHDSSTSSKTSDAPSSELKRSPGSPESLPFVTPVDRIDAIAPTTIHAPASTQLGTQTTRITPPPVFGEPAAAKPSLAFESSSLHPITPVAETSTVTGITSSVVPVINPLSNSAFTNVPQSAPVVGRKDHISAEKALSDNAFDV